MRAVFALVTALAVQAPATVRLQIRVFNALEEVTSETRVTLYKTGDHGSPVGVSPSRTGFDAPVAAGLYDAQAVHLKDSRVVNIRWAERLVVMPYPDEAGVHLEVINFESDFGALEVKGRRPVRAALYAEGERTREAVKPVSGSDYVLFVAPAARYDLRLETAGQVSWHTGVDVPRDRTRFWIVP